MYLCVLDREGNKRLYRNMRAKPDDFLRAIRPFREGLVVGVECMFTWYWLADLCLDESLDFILGHALYMKAIHGGKNKDDRIDSEMLARKIGRAVYQMLKRKEAFDAVKFFAN